MEKCLFNGKEIYASDVYKDYEYESEVRAAGRKGQLKCFNQNCKTPVIYKYGGNRNGMEAKKVAHFSHLVSDTKCEYDYYFTHIKFRNNITKNIVNKCYDALHAQYPQAIIKKEEKVIDNHWTDICINNGELAIEFVNSYKTPKYMADMILKYEQKGIKQITIVIDELNKEMYEYDFNNAKRIQLHSHNGILLLIDKDGDKITLIKYDKNNYNINLGTTLFRIEKSFSDLDLLYDPNFTYDFEEKFEKFVENRKKEYEQHLLAQEEKTSTQKATLDTYVCNNLFTETPKVKAIDYSSNYYDASKSEYPLSKDKIEYYLEMYFNNSGSKRINASNVLRNGCKYCEITKSNFIQFYINSSDSYKIKIRYQFEDIIKN